MNYTFKSGKKLETFLRMLAEESVNKVHEDALIGEEADEESFEADAEQQLAPEDDEAVDDADEKETDLDDETAVKKEDDIAFLLSIGYADTSKHQYKSWVKNANYNEIVKWK